ncbi:BTB/POZ domain-containing protein 2 [Exaiptasia diaphana]|nr:BTB/POZ domain-containing protein 2 [Exaiptasia diaphana]
MAEIENSSWQTQFSTLRERVEYAFNNSLFCDIEFTVEDSNGDKVALSANKFILSVSSPVFETMFQGKLAEQGPQIHLPDCTKDGLQEMLRFLHSDGVNLTGSNVMEVLYLADKYMLPLLQDKCYEYLADNLTPDDVFTVLPQAQQLNNTRAEELCWNVQVLERETLHTDEVNLFKAVDSWASNRIDEESNKENSDAKRSVLGDDIVHLIRFPMMTPKEFADDVLVSDILRGSEVTEVIQIFTSTAPLQTLFKRVKRSGQWNEMWTENRFDAVDTKYCGGQQNHAILFEVNKPIFLAGIRLFAVQSESGTKLSESKLSVQNVKCKSKLFQTDVSSNVKQTIDSGGLYSGQSVTISPPILLLSKEKYSITYSANVVHVLSFEQAFRKADKRTGIIRREPAPPFGQSANLREPMKEPSSPRTVSNFTSYLGSGGKSVVHCDDIKITFMNSEESNPGTTIEYGQFPSLLLKRRILLKKDPVPLLSFGNSSRDGFDFGSGKSSASDLFGGTSNTCLDQNSTPLVDTEEEA